jgi:hypothetical protein
MNFKGTLPWDQLSRKNIEDINERKRIREQNPLSVPPESAYKAKQEDKFDHNHARGGIKSEDEDYMTHGDVDAVTQDLWKKHYGLMMADDRRVRRGADQREMNNALVDIMDKIYLGYANYTKEKSTLEKNSTSRSCSNTEHLDWKHRADELKLVDLNKIKAVEIMCKTDLDEARANIPTETETIEDKRKVSTGMEGDCNNNYSNLEIGDEPAEGLGNELYSGDHPNEEQERIIDLYYKRARARINHALDPINHEKPKGQLLTYVDCGPGAGKTWLTQELFRRVNVYASRVGYSVTKSTSFFPSGTTGAACVTLGHGCVTCHTGFNFGKIAKDGDEINDRLPPLAINKEVMLKDKLNICSTSKSSHCAVTVDETFMLLSIQLGHIDQRCREMTGIDDDFGGLDVHLQGDSMQFDAVGENLYGGAMIDLLPWERDRPPVESPKARGRRLFRKFKRIDTLKKLPRSEGCERLKNIINQLRDRSILYPITDEVLNSLKELSVEDLINDPVFLESFITVGTNHERLALNLSHSKAYAVSKGLPLVRWRKQLKGKLSARLIRTPELKQDLYSSPEHEENLHQYFVEDISAIILTNKNTSRGIVNGADVKLYGLWYKSETDRHEYEELRAAAEPGEIVTLSKPPDAVLVEIPDTTAVEWEKDCTLIDEKHIIPIFMDYSDYSDYYTEEKEKKKLSYNSFPYDLGGVRTGYKIQGATTPRLTCNFNARPKGCRTHLSHRSFFVSISRVKSIDHFRFVPFLTDDRAAISYMKKFSMDPKVRILPRCYNEAGEWTATTNDIIRWFDELGVAWRPKATRKHPLRPEELEVLRNYPNMFEQSKREEQIREKSRITKLSNNSRRKKDADETLLKEDTTILERDAEILKSIRLNDNGQVKIVSTSEVYQDQVTATPTLNTRKIDDRRKKQKKEESPLQVRRYELPNSNEEMEQTPTRKRKVVASHSKVLDL